MGHRGIGPCNILFISDILSALVKERGEGYNYLTDILM